MFRNHFKIATRVLSKSKLFSLINMAGLAIGISAYLLITQYVRFESSYDTQHSRIEDMYKMCIRDSLTEEDYINNNFIVMCTKNGTIKKTSLEAYSRPRQNGINAITIHEGDELLNVNLTNGSNHIVIAKKSGKAIHFNEQDVRPMGRTAAGVRAVKLEGDDDQVIGMVCVAREDANLLVVTEKGYGKRSEIEAYRITKRGGKGVKAMNVTEKTGSLVAIKEVIDTDDLMIINKSGITIRLAVGDLRVMGRATQGVRLIKLGENDEISSVEKIEKIEGDDIEDVQEENNTSTEQNNDKE